MKTPHKHAELIKAWADGAEIEVKDTGIWHTIKMPMWDGDNYRIKPEPKPDFYVTWFVTGHHCPLLMEKGNLKVTFDGGTGRPKSAEVIS